LAVFQNAAEGNVQIWPETPVRSDSAANFPRRMVDNSPETVRATAENRWARQPVEVNPVRLGSLLFTFFRTPRG
jgi:hypothetical protein